MKKIRELCYQLHSIGIKPSLLLAGSSLMDELHSYQKHSTTSSFWIKDLQIDGFTLEVFSVDAENFCEVYGREAAA